jgi:cyclopropane-fatty-acyl-phospholipid synthase
MPSHNLLSYFQKHLSLEKDWIWNCQHYQKTSEAWLVNCDRNKDKILPLFKDVYGNQEAVLMFHRWRIFFLAVAELFGFDQGRQWAVSHYLFKVK